MNPLDDLIARLEGAGEGNALLDVEIARALGWTCLAEHQDNDRTRFAVKNAHDIGDWTGLNWTDEAGTPKGDCREWPFTASLDVARSLVSDDMRFMVEGGMGRGGAQVWRPNMSKFFDCKRANTPELALCIAALKARQP